MTKSNTPWYTYIHYRASDRTPFYVGKGKWRRMFAKENRNIYWHRTVAKHGLIVERCAAWDSEEDAFTHEKFLIECLSSLGAKLCNLTKGGEGPSGMKHGEEMRRKMSLAHKGRPKSEAHKKALKEAAARSSWVRPKGVRHSEEAKQKISNALRGREHHWIANKPGHGRKKTVCVSYGIEFESSLWAILWLREGGFQTACRTTMRDKSKVGKEYCGLLWKIG
jgi:hypothetical protein